MADKEKREVEAENGGFWTWFWKPKVKPIISNEKEMQVRPEYREENASPDEIRTGKKDGKSFFGIKFTWPFVVALAFLVGGCANVSTTKFKFIGAEGRTLEVEMPKEMMATNFKVTIDAASGEALITADEISTSPVAGMQMEALRQRQMIESIAGSMGTVGGKAGKAMVSP